MICYNRGSDFQAKTCQKYVYTVSNRVPLLPHVAQGGKEPPVFEGSERRDMMPRGRLQCTISNRHKAGRSNIITEIERHDRVVRRMGSARGARSVGSGCPLHIAGVQVLVELVTCNYGVGSPGLSNEPAWLLPRKRLAGHGRDPLGKRKTCTAEVLMGGMGHASHGNGHGLKWAPRRYGEEAEEDPEWRASTGTRRRAWSWTHWQ